MAPVEVAMASNPDFSMIWALLAFHALANPDRWLSAKTGQSAMAGILFSAGYKKTEDI